MMTHFRRLSLVLLLLLMLIGIAGHVIQPASGSHHILSDSTCAFHHGINVPMSLQPFWDGSGISLEPTHDDSCALDLVLNIHHPPTF